LTYGGSLPYTAAQILDRSRYCFDAETVDTHDLTYWKEQTDRLNQHYLGKEPEAMSTHAPAKAAPMPDPVTPPAGLPQAQFPILNLPQLLSHPVKGAKGQDLERILSSPRSEDYVTWNVVQLLKACSPAAWWPELLMAARADNPHFTLNPAPDDLPVLELWQKIAAPKAYESLSRERMAASGVPQWEQRALDPKPVEGPSEIDLVVRGRQYLIFIEAKLDADISTNTTYDPGRNQIIRNIDVLLEVCGYRTPVFWMMAKDKGPKKAYIQVMRRYQQDPGALVSDLPHRDPHMLKRVASNLAIVSWKDILPLVGTEGEEGVYQELIRRI
jgi:hypothetical protein